MSATDVLDGLLRRLHGANAPTVARHTVAGIFATLRRASGLGEETRANAIAACLSRPNKVIAQEAAEQTLALSFSGGATQIWGGRTALVLAELRAQLLGGGSAVVRSAAATGLAVLAGSLAADPAVYIRTGGGGGGGGEASREMGAVAEAVAALTGSLGALCPPLAPALAELAEAGLPAGWPRVGGGGGMSYELSYAPKPLASEADEQEVVPGTAVALASLLCDVNRAHGLPAAALPRLLAALVRVAAAAAGDGEGAVGVGGGGGGGGGDGAAAAAAVAALEAAAVLAPEALRYQMVAAEELSYTLAALRRLYGGGGGGGGATDGRVRGAAAYCLGCAAVAALRQGVLAAAAAAAGSPDGPQPEALAAAAALSYVTELAELAAGGGGGGAAAVGASAVGRGQHSAAARTGAVAGLAAMLLPPPPSLLDGLAPLSPGAAGAGLLAQPEYLAPAKAAVRALESLVGDETDPWVAAAAAFHLAAVSAAVALVRLAVGAPPGLRLRLLRFLGAHLALGPRGSEADRMRAVQCTVDLLDILEAALYDIDAATAVQPGAAGGAAAAEVAAAGRSLADVLLQLAFEVMYSTPGGGGGGGAQELVAALLRLRELVPGVLAGRLAALALLTLSAYGKELQGLHLLLHRALLDGQPPQPPQPKQHQPTPADAAADAALSLQPLLAAVAFGTSALATPATSTSAASPSAWPAHLALTLQRIMDASGGDDGGSGAVQSYGMPPPPPSPLLAHSDLCLHRQCRLLLLSLWAEAAAAAPGRTPPPPPYDLLRWLGSLELSLRQRRRAAAVSKAAADQLPFAASRAADAAAADPADAHPAVACTAAALLAHPDPRVRVAAAAAARELVLLLPAAALPLLPLVMYQLQRGSYSGYGGYGGGGGDGAAAAAAQLALLQLLPVMAAEAAMAPYALRLLQPLLGGGGTVPLRCLGLKLVCDTWLLTGRGWPQVESALNGLTPPGARDPPPQLQVTRAALVRAVCDRDPG
ncbi:hypothetical protein TSOC_009493, partial [Tetrabaena socialis]